MEERFFEVLQHSPWVAITGFLLWRMTSQSSDIAPVIRDVSDAVRRTAEVVREIRIQWDADRRILEDALRQNAARLEQVSAKLDRLLAQRQE